VHKDVPENGRCIVVCFKKDNTKSLPENGRFFYVFTKRSEIGGYIIPSNKGSKGRVE
jgi:hypothetical protein